MNARRILALATLSVFSVISLAVLPAHAAIYTYSCILNPRQESPLVASSAMGAGRFVIDTDANTVNYRITFAGLSSAETAAHIHGSATSSPGNNAGVLHALPAGNPKVGVWNYLEAQEPLILAGLCYANIHSTNFPGGELRGQIVPFNALLDAAQETTANASTAKGWATGTVDTAANTISYYLFYEGLSGAPNAAHFHGNQLHGTAGGVKVGLTLTASPMSGTVSYLQADEGALLAGRWYLNMHTALSPGGEIRGQFVNTVIPMDALQEVGPTTATGSSAFGMLAIDTLANVLSYDVRELALTGPDVGSHIHGFASRTSTAGVLQALAAGTQKLGTWAYGAANENSVFAGLTYLNIHTDLNPGGEIRGQIESVPGSNSLTSVGSTPRALSGLAAAPNPFGGRTVLSFQLSRTGSVSLSIVGVDGGIVRRIPAAMFAPGAHSFEWDGRDDNGQVTAPGVFFAIVRTPDGARTTRIARLR